MANLDLNYIADLVIQAQEGDSNAFAELFAATHQKLYAFARDFLGDDFLAQEALQSSYIEALKNISKLRQTTLVIPWLNQLALRNCLRIQAQRAQLAPDSRDNEIPENRALQLGGRRYAVRQVLTLPFSEAQAILLRHLCGLSLRDAASLLELRRGAALRAIDSGIRRLRRLYDMEGSAGA